MRAKVRQFLFNTALLGGAAILMRTVGVVWSAYVSDRVGAACMGLFSLVMSIYGFSVTFAVSGINLAVTRLVAAALARGKPGAAAAVMRRAVLYALLFGGVSSAVLLLFAPFIGGTLLGDLRTVTSVRALGISMLPIALSAVFSGYFTAVRRVSRNAAASVFEQLVRISLIFTGLTVLLPRGLEYACLALVLGGAVAEVISFLFLFLQYLADRRKHLFARPEAERGMLGSILHISLPIAFSAYLRSGLNTVEHLLIPRALIRGGRSREDALASYGILTGMALPLVLYPMAPLSAAASLLVPEFAERKALGNPAAVSSLVSRALHLTLLYSIGCTVLLTMFADEFGQFIYRSAEAGRYIRILAPVIPIMFADHVTDCILKGIGEQVWSMWVNIADSLLSIGLVMLLLPGMGAAGYAVLIVLAEIFNFSLSVGRLYKVTRFRLDLSVSLMIPLLSAFSAAALTRHIFIVRVENGLPTFLFQILFAALLYTLPFLYYSLLKHRKFPTDLFTLRP